MNREMTILFCTCDKYKDLWTPFFTIFKNEWENCNYEILINTETESFTFDGLNIKTLNLYKKGAVVTYGKRMIDHINAIQTKFTLIVLDDFFLREKVDEIKIHKIIDYLENHPAIECVRLTPYQHRNTYEKCIPLEDFPGYYQVAKCAEYKLNFQACLWRTKDLLGYWREDDDPWKWEVFANITTFNSPGFLVVGEDEGPILDYGYKVNGQPLSDIYRGKWVKDNGLEELFAKNQIVVDFDKRGYYNPSEEPQHFTDFGTILYVLKRIGLRNTIILSAFIVKNKIRAMLHMAHYKMSEYPIAFKGKCIDIK